MRRPSSALCHASVLALLWTTGACKKPTVPEDVPLCRAEVVGHEAREVQERSLEPNLWFSILVRGYDRTTRTLSREVRDCARGSIEIGRLPADKRCPQQELARRLPGRELTDRDLVEAPLPDDQSLVWVKIHHYEDGRALGPVALVEWVPQGVAVRTLGNLYAHANRARLRLEIVGDRQVLVAESDACDEEGRNCDRVARFMLLEGEHFVEVPVVDATGRCLGQAEFYMHRERDVRLDDTWRRKFALDMNIRFEDGAATIHEQISVHDRDSNNPELPPKLFRRATAERPIEIVGRTIRSKQSLWGPMIEEHGSVRPEAAPPSE